jgi:hypothetical protein
MFSLKFPGSKISADKTAVATADLLHRGSRGRHLAVAMMLLGMPISAQFHTSPGNATVPTVQDPGAPSDAEGPLDSRMEAKRIALLNAMRQKSIVSDSDKLLQLAEKLQQDADAGGTRMNPAQRMHTAAEIERLAKAVKDKMTYAIGAEAPAGGAFSVFR